MPQIGASPFSFRGPLGWGGMTTANKSAPGKFDLLEDCYVSADGGELRHRPGFVCVIDPATTTRSATSDTQTGYVITHLDARRPVRTAVTGPYYKEDTAPSADMRIWTRPTQLHCVEQVHGRWVFVGESDLRREPISPSGGGTTWVRVISYDDNAGTSIDLTLNTNPLVTADTFNSVQVGSRIYLEGLGGVLASILNGFGHNVSAIAGAVVTISTNPGGAIANQTGQAGLISRITNPNLASGTGQSDDVESLTAWVSLVRGDPTISPTTLVYPAHVANRMRDFGDATTGASTGNLKEGNAAGGTVAGGRSRRRQRGLPFRVNPHVAGERLILAAPGYGCVFQVPQVIPTNLDNLTAASGVNSVTNEIYDRPQALGVPKCVLWEDPDKAEATSSHFWTPGSAASAFGGSDASVAGREGTYKFKFAYRNDATGEVGLCSEEIELTTTTAAPAFRGIQFGVYFPGYLMHESLALSINVYRTTKGGDTFYFDRTVSLDGVSYPGGGTVSSKYGLQPYTVTTDFYHHMLVQLTYSTDAELESHEGTVPDTLQQMPMGCKAARTARGWTAFGGALGNAGTKRELQQGTLTLWYDRNTLATDGISYNLDEVMSAYTNDFASPAINASFEGVETGFGCAARNIPPAYAGQTIVSKTLLPFPRKEVALNKLVNTKVGYVGVSPGDFAAHLQDVRYQVRDTPLVAGTDLRDTTLQPAYLKLPRSKLQISEADNPHITPATNTTVLADEIDEDVEGIGIANGQFVCCTRSKTYLLGFSQSPVGVPAEISSDRFGCIAANSMVEFDGGCAWLSDRGPVANIGGVTTWIGQDLERFFIGETSRYLRDGDGMMRHSWGCHDAERGLIYFGVFADRFAATSQRQTVTFRGTTYNWTTAQSSQDRDEILSRFACDEILVYSYRVGAWSVWRPPGCIAMQWMTRGQDDRGNSRVFFLGSDKRLYVLDDTYGDGSKDCYVCTATDTGTLSTIQVTTSSVDISRIGLTCVVYGADGDRAILRGVRTITADTGTAVTLDSAIPIEAGDTILMGARTMRLRTTFATFKGTQTQQSGNVTMRFDLLSRISAGLGGTVEPSVWATGTLNTVVREGRIKEPKSATLTRGDEDDDPDYRWLGSSYQNSPECVESLSRGLATGASHQVDITVVGGAQIRLHDLFAEVA